MRDITVIMKRLLLIALNFGFLISCITPQANTSDESITQAVKSPTILDLATASTTPDASATQQYQNFYSIVQKLYADGEIASIEGNFIRMRDYFDQSTAVGTYDRFEFFNSRYSRNIIIQADIVFETEHGPNATAGCGFVFGFDTSENYEFVFLQRNGFVLYGSRAEPFTREFYREIDSPVAYKMMVVEYKSRVSVYIDGNKVIDAQPDLNVNTDIPLMSALLGPALLGGTTEGLNTSCDFQNIILWEIKE